jgi:glycosyltransferase involved in cell wall biosynthesis
MIPYSQVSIVVPCRNEEANILRLRELMDEFPTDLELILIEGGSNDGTADQCRIMAATHPGNVKFIYQTQKGKMNAVMEGILESSREHIAIFDADLTVSLKDQLRLIDLFCLDRGESFVMGNRLNRKIHRGSMQAANIIGNYGFGVLFSILTRRRIMDTLCGTKIFPKQIVISPVCRDIVLRDPFGDFSLISNAWLYGLKIRSVDVEYFPRRYGSTNIKRWTSGALLLKIFVLFALKHGLNPKKGSVK